MNPYDLVIFFRVFHPTMNAEDVCKGLNLIAKKSWSSGGHRRNHLGVVQEGRNERTYCLFELPDIDREDMDTSLEAAASLLLPKREFLQHISATGGDAEFYLQMFADQNSGDSLNWRLLTTLGDLHIQLAFDFYPYRRPS